MATCGTYSGYQAHHRRGETPCQPCRDASNTYQRNRWNTDPAARAKQRAYSAARSRAISRLIATHRAEYARLLTDERTKEG